MADDVAQVSRPADVTVPIEGRAAEVLTPEALAFLAELHRKFDARRLELLARRQARQKRFDAGESPDFLPETQAVRDGDWKVAPIPADLQDRRVEITGPTDRKMIINALNCGAKVFMTDFEDANAPTWANMVDGQVEPDRPLGRQAQLRRSGHRQVVPAERQACGADRASTRLAPAGAPRRRRRRSRCPARWSISGSTSSTTPRRR